METIRLSARLRAARKAAGFKTSKSFIKKHKIPASTYSQHESGARTPDDDTLKSYSKIFSVNFDWLKDGKGLPYTKMNSGNNVFHEELLDLNSFNNKTLNESLLSSILNEVLSLHTKNLSKLQTKKIAKDTIMIYSSIESSSNKSVTLKSALNSYKIKMSTKK